MESSYYRRWWAKMHCASLDFSYVLSEREEINSLLYKPINSTQRIKYTCFNVSLNYIILGSTSGSLYLFCREPCLFLQIIPLSEGVVSRVAISPDEKTVALTTTRDIVCLVSLKPTPRLITVSTEYIYKQITCLCWNKNNTEVYIGDAVGRISVMVLSIFTVNGMFQTRVYTLMNLDSSVMQLSFCSSLLLISTLTRCYICDTSQEQYKQIGNKARNGEFGACFYEAQTYESGITLDAERMEAENIGNSRGTFNLISDNDSNILSENYPKIFCARPGSRLWEVSADGVVIKTHQLKEALAVSPTTIFRSAANPSSSHEVKDREQTERTEREWPAQSVNFTHLFVVASKYLFSHTTSGLYVVDPANASVLLWSNEFTNISMAAVASDKIYLMTIDSEFHCLTLSSLSALILRLYRCEEYRECLRACVLYKKHLSKTIAKKEMLELLELNDLPQAVDSSREKEEVLPLRLRSLMTLLRSGSNDRPPAKLESGIVVVHPDNDEFVANRRTYCETTSASQSPEISSEDSSEMQTPEIANELAENLAQEDTQETTDSDYNAETLVKNENYQTSHLQESITYRVQADLESIYTLANNIKIGLPEKVVEEIVSDIDRKMRMIKESYKDSPGLEAFLYEVTRAAELNCYNSFLESTSVQLLRSTSNDRVVRQFVRAFTDINAPSYARCGCGYPRPMEQSIVEPKFLEIGQSLVARFANNLPEECGNICDKVPYMWREYLAARIERRDTLDDVLRQCLQTRDNVVLSFLLPALNEQQWSCVDACISEIKNGTCLFCATSLVKKPDCDMLINWSGIAREIMAREGPDKATAFLKKLQTMMPDVTLDKTIFQSIIFTKILHHHGLKKSIDFSKNNQLSAEFGTMCSLQVRDQLVKALEKDTRRPIDMNMFGTSAHHWGVRHQTKSLACPCCTLSLQTPILLGNKGVAIFRCGHAYHVNCMIERKLTRCNLHQ